MTWKNIFKKFQMDFMLEDILYMLDRRILKKSSVKKYLQENIEIAYSYQKEWKLPKYKGTQDEKMLKILRYVKNQIKYKPDIELFKTVEKWQYLHELLDLKEGDCEDGAMLIYILAMINGINMAQVRLCAGWVNISNKKVGHCWIEYAPDEMYDYNNDRQRWYTIDWCYWYDSTNFKNRLTKNKSRYLSTWWNITAF